MFLKTATSCLSNQIWSNRDLKFLLTTSASTVDHVILYNTLFWSALVASLFRKRRYGWFNDKHKVKLNLSSLQLVFNDYKPPSKVLVKT